MVQDFLANLAPYIDSLDSGIVKAGEFAAANKAAEDAVAAMADMAEAAAGLVDAAMAKATHSVEQLAAAVAAASAKSLNIDVNINGDAKIAALAAQVAGLNDKTITLTVLTPGLDAANRAITSMNLRLGSLNAKVLDTIVHFVALDVELDKKKAAFMGTSAMIAALAAALAATNAALAKTTGATAAATTANRAWVGGMALTGKALHWIVMGSLEILSTAVPAMVALGAAAAGMYPTFVRIFDATNNLVTASGSMRSAALNSVGPLHNLGVQMGVLSQKMAPDAYIIFGSVINDLTGRVGAFSGVAQQAGNVLAAFATKLTTELQGPLGGQLAGFFANGVKFMVQWGQVLGSLGHAFLDFASHMAGVGHVLLDVLNMLSRALLAIAANPVAERLIEVAAAMSAVYRYGQLLVTIFNLIARSAIVMGIRTMVAQFTTLMATFAAMGVEANALSVAMAVLRVNMMSFIASPVGVAIAALAVVMGIWWLATRSTADATSQLVSRVESATPSVHNLSTGIGTLTAHLLSLTNAYSRVASYDVGLAQQRYLADAQQLTAAIRKQAQELLNLETAMAQVHAGTGAVAAGEAALAIQTALADAKVQQLNQALDQYMQLVTGGTAGLAGFVTSLANIGQVAATTANNLGTATGSMTLSVTQFGRALDQQMSAKGASAWQNFDQVIGSTMPQMMDWFRQASTLGAAMGTTVSQAALDMTAMMIRYAGSNATAQAQVLAFARAQGLSFTSFAALKKAVPSAAAAQADLAKQVDTTTIALSNLSQMAKNAASALNTQMSAAIATNAMKASGLDAAINKYQTDLAGGHATRAQLLADIGAINRDMAIAQQITVQTGNAAGSAFGQMAAAAGRGKAAFDGMLQSAQRLQAYIDTMHGKTIVLTMITTQSGQPTGAGGYAGPGGGGHSPGALFRIPGATPGVPSRPAFVESAVHVQVAVPGAVGGGGGTTVVNHHYNVTVNNAGSVIAQQDLVREIVRHVGRATNRNMSNQLAYQGRGH